MLPVERPSVDFVSHPLPRSHSKRPLQLPHMPVAVACGALGTTYSFTQFESLFGYSIHMKNLRVEVIHVIIFALATRRTLDV